MSPLTGRKAASGPEENPGHPSAAWRRAGEDMGRAWLGRWGWEGSSALTSENKRKTNAEVGNLKQPDNSCLPQVNTKVYLLWFYYEVSYGKIPVTKKKDHLEEVKVVGENV